MDKYKVEILTKMLNRMKENDWYLCRVKSDDGDIINIDENAIKLLIEYYK